MTGLEPAPSLSVRTVRIIAPISAVVASLALLAVAGAWWAPLEVNRLARAEEQRQVANNLRQRLDRFAQDQRGTAIWDDAVSHIRIAYDEEWVVNNIGVWITQQFGHHEIFLVDERDHLLFAFVDGERADAGAYERHAAAFGSLLGEVRRARQVPGAAAAAGPEGAKDAKADVYANRRDIQQVTRFALVEGRPAMVGGIAVVPDFFTVQPPPGPPAILLTIRFLDGATLDEVAADLLLSRLTYLPPGGAAAPELGAVLPVAGDPRLGQLAWAPKRPGDLLRAYVLPSALAVAAAAFLSTLMAVRHARRVTGDLVASEARARHLAYHDAVTGQPNRRLFSERMDRALATDTRLAVLCLDLDRFKEINDAFGHAAGDDLIRQVAQRLRDAVRDGDLVARLGGDEFAILVPHLHEPGDAIGVCERLLAIFDAPFSIVGSEVRVSVSIGIALAPEDGSQHEELMRRADIALYRAKAQGRGIYRFFSREMDESLQLRRTVDADLREALATGQLALAYQPLYERDGATIRGVEALARWHHPERGPIPPNFFVSVAEDSDLIHVLGEWVLRRACADAVRWTGLTVAVNLSPRQIRAASFPRLVARILAETGLEPGRLELEVTEGVLMDDSGGAREVLAELRAFGVQIALDDFGTGYSSLSYLRRFDFHRVKIDRSFVRALSASPDAAAIVRAVVDLGRALGMEITAEGVETKEQHRFLREIGCDRLQGFLFSRPLPAAEIGPLVGCDRREPTEA